MSPDKTISLCCPAFVLHTLAREVSSTLAKLPFPQNRDEIYSPKSNPKGLAGNSVQYFSVGLEGIRVGLASNECPIQVSGIPLFSVTTM